MTGTEDIQIQAEREALNVLENKEYRKLMEAITHGRFNETSYGNALMKTYFIPIRDKIQEYLDARLLGHTGKTQRYIKYLCSDASQIAFVVLQTIIRKIAQRNNSVKVTLLSTTIIHSLKTLHSFDSAAKNNPKLIAYLGNEYKRASAKRKRQLMKKHLKDFNDDEGSTSTTPTRVKAGTTLIDIVLSSGVNMVEKRLLFIPGIDKHRTLYIQFTADVIEVLKTKYYIPPTLALLPPMVVPPTDWTSFNAGGYRTIKNAFIKTGVRALRKRIQNEDFSKPMTVINKLQKTKWRVNNRIKTIIKYMYENNIIDPRSPPTLPRLYGEIPTSNPSKVWELMDGFGIYPKNPTAEEKKSWAIWNNKKEKIQIGLDAEQGRRIQYMMTIGIADKMEEYDAFYYVYQLDYRGRVYPITDFFNPQSKGYVKSMLEFADGHYLDEIGIKWLYIHIANTYGLDKAPYETRIQWTKDNIHNILEAANCPMSTLSYWTSSDSPYEFLAACMALQDHIEGREVHLPIQLDAVNSGIQMYSGLLRDREGAKSTCVIGSERSDLYGEVADSVNSKLLAGEYPSYITFTDKEGVEKLCKTEVEAKSMTPQYEIVEVADNYTLKKGEEWFEEKV